MNCYNSVIDSPQVVFNKLMSLEKEIQSVVPNCNVIISNLIKRKDNRQANSINGKVNQQIKNSQLRVINIDTIKEKQLGKRGLHLNTHGNLLLTNVLHAIRNPKWNGDDYDSDFIGNNVFFCICG